VKATAGNTHLGGEDFDNRMVNYTLGYLKRSYNMDLTTNKRAVRRLHAACERAKCTLSDLTEASIKTDFLFNRNGNNLRINRALFEQLNADLFRSIMELVTNSLQDAKLKKAQIHDIVLIGGSTRIPKVQKLLQEFFKGKELNKSIKLDEAVAYGAAVQAAILAGVDKSEQVQDLLWVDVTPMSLGIGTNEGVMDVFIRRNTPIPTKQTKIYTVQASYLPDMLIKVYEGEKAMTKYNYLGHLKINTYRFEKSANIQIEVTFDVDANGTLNVTAMEKLTGKKDKITLNNYKRRLSKAEVELMANDAENYRAEDEQQKKTISAKDILEAYCYKMCSAVEDVKRKGKISESDENIILGKCNEVICWLDANQLAEKEEFESQQKQLESICNSIMRKCY
jgi:L1 cell adhesion molecule like protein